MSFDARPLTAPVDPAAVRDHARRMRAHGEGMSARGVIVIIVFAVMALFFLGTFGSVVAGFVTALTGDGGWGAIGGIIPLLAFAAIGIAVGFALRGMLRSSAERRYRLDAFARANHMHYIPSITNPPLPGMIFSQGSSRKASDLVRGDRPRFVEFGNHRYTTGSGKNRKTHEWGYVAVKLDVPLPHIVLDATSNNGLFGSNLPSTFARSQRLSLEGDFDRYFSLYCPEGYETDALYLFTPDIMARFIDNAAALDVEIVDDWLFLYTKRDAVTLDPASWAWMFGAVAATLDKLAQWERWRDDRLRAESRAATADAPATVAAGFDDPAGGATATVPFDAPTGMLRPPPGVAAPGRRLSRGVRWWTIALVGVVLGWWVLTGVLPLLFGR